MNKKNRFEVTTEAANLAAEIGGRAYTPHGVCALIRQACVGGRSQSEIAAQLNTKKVVRGNLTNRNWKWKPSTISEFYMQYRGKRLSELVPSSTRRTPWPPGDWDDEDWGYSVPRRRKPFLKDPNAVTKIAQSTASRIKGKALTPNQLCDQVAEMRASGQTLSVIARRLTEKKIIAGDYTERGKIEWSPSKVGAFFLRYRGPIRKKEARKQRVAVRRPVTKTHVTPDDRLVLYMEITEVTKVEITSPTQVTIKVTGVVDLSDPRVRKLLNDRLGN